MKLLEFKVRYAFFGKWQKWSSSSSFTLSIQYTLLVFFLSRKFSQKVRQEFLYDTRERSFELACSKRVSSKEITRVERYRAFLCFREKIKKKRRIAKIHASSFKKKLLWLRSKSGIGLGWSDLKTAVVFANCWYKLCTQSSTGRRYTGRWGADYVQACWLLLVCVFQSVRNIWKPTNCKSLESI